LILKLVNGAVQSVKAAVSLPRRLKYQPSATATVVVGIPNANNKFSDPDLIVPKAGDIAVGPSFECQLPAYFFTVIRGKRE